MSETYVIKQGVCTIVHARWSWVPRWLYLRVRFFRTERVVPLTMKGYRP
jgi:hypothetical protein